MIDKLFDYAAQGRGYWCGLFVKEIPDQHITLAHFGRGVDPGLVERALTGCKRSLDPAPGILLARSWATARMDQKRGSVIALLLESPDLVAYRQTLVRCMTSCGVRVDDRFGFHPHVTLRRLPRSETVAMEAADPVCFSFWAVSLVCGEARVDFDLRHTVSVDPDQIALPFV